MRRRSTRRLRGRPRSTARPPVGQRAELASPVDRYREPSRPYAARSDRRAPPGFVRLGDPRHRQAAPNLATADRLALSGIGHRRRPGRGSPTRGQSYRSSYATNDEPRAAALRASSFASASRYRARSRVYRLPSTVYRKRFTSARMAWATRADTLSPLSAAADLASATRSFGKWNV